MDIVIGRRPVSIPLLPIVTVLLIAFLLFMSMRVARIQGSEIGVFVNNLTGRMQVEVHPGAHVYNGFLTDFHVVDNTVQVLRLSHDAGQNDVNIKTQDGSDVSLDVELNYRLLQDPELIRSRVVPECGLVRLSIAARRGTASERDVDAYKLVWVRDYARSVIRYVFGELKTDEFYLAEARDRKARQSEQALNDLLRPHGIEVMKVVPARYRFYEEYEKKIAERQEAEQEVLSQMALADAALQGQKHKEVEATAKANVEIERMKGELKKQTLVAEADASREKLGAEGYAVTTKTAAEAEFYRQQNDAKSQLAKAQAEAEGTRRLAQSLAGEGGRNLVRLELSKVLQGAVITGVPYLTDPVVQKVEVTAPAAASGARREGQ